MHHIKVLINVYYAILDIIKISLHPIHAYHVNRDIPQNYYQPVSIANNANLVDTLRIVALVSVYYVKLVTINHHLAPLDVFNVLLVNFKIQLIHHSAIHALVVNIHQILHIHHALTVPLDHIKI